MITALGEKLENVSASVVLRVNAGLGAFVFIAHGAALLLVLGGRVPVPPASAAFIRAFAPFTLLTAWLVIIGSALGEVRPGGQRVVLRAQALILFTFGIGLLAWAGSVLIEGIPEGNFGWTPGMLTCWVAYSVFLCARFAFPRWQSRKAAVYVVVAVAAALPIDVGVFLRLIAKMIATMSHM